MIRIRLFLGAMAAGLKDSLIQVRDGADIDDPWALSGGGFQGTAVGENRCNSLSNAGQTQREYRARTTCL